MKSLVLFIFSFLSGSMVVRAQVIQCQNQGDSDCVKSVTADLQKATTAISVEKCFDDMKKLKCEAFFKDYPEFTSFRRNCYGGDVCRSRKEISYIEACSSYGIKLRDTFVSAVKEEVSCLKEPSCFSKKQLQGILLPSFQLWHSLFHWKSEVKELGRQIQKDYREFKALNCLQESIRHELLCHLNVKYGAAVLSTTPVGGRAKSIVNVDGLESALLKFDAKIRPFSWKRWSRRLDKSGDIVLMRDGKALPLREGLEKNKSYTVIIHKDKIYLGDDYFGETGTRQASHVKLLRDVDRHNNNGERSPNWDPLDYENRGGAVRIHEDGSVDISGYHQGKPSEVAAESIASFFSKWVDGGAIRKTPDRLDTLPKKNP